MDEELLQLHTMKRDLLKAGAGLRLQLAHLRWEETEWFLSFRRTALPGSRSDLEVANSSFDLVREELHFQRDSILSELVEVRLLLADVTDQIETFG
jgi:hypothetical protein